MNDLRDFQRHGLQTIVPGLVDLEEAVVRITVHFRTGLSSHTAPME